MSKACRFAACVIVASGVLASARANAQPLPAGIEYGPSGALYYSEPAQAVYGQPAPAAACGCPACSGGLAGPDACPPAMYGGPYAPGHGHGGRYISHQVPYGFDDTLELSPFEEWLSKVVRNMWVRLEYLSYDIDEPGEELLGEGTRRADDPRLPFGFFEPDPVIPGLTNLVAQARAQDLGRFTYLDTDGMRLTLGVPYREFDFEWSGWVLEQNTGKARADLRERLLTPGVREFAVITTLINGQPGDARVLLFDQSFEAATHVEVWGTDMKWLFPLSPQWPGFRCDPLIEARFLYLHENLNVVGGFSGDGPLTMDPLGPALLTGIDSDSTNYLYGAGVGVSARFVHPWITVGIEPRVSLALNSFRNRVVAENVLVSGDRQVTIEEDTVFSPVAEVGAFVKFHPTPHCTLVAGYNVFVLAQVTRPYDSIRYNLNTDPGTGAIVSSDISVDTEFHTMVFHGWSVGGEISFR